MTAVETKENNHAHTNKTNRPSSKYHNSYMTVNSSQQQKITVYHNIKLHKRMTKKRL